MSSNISVKCSGCWSGLPSLPPPIYLPTNLVSLLDCKGLAAREAEHKKWLTESQATLCDAPIGIRAMDLDDDLGLDLEDEEGNDSIEEDEDEEEEEIDTQEMRDSESGIDDQSEWIANRFDEEDDSSIEMHGINDLSLQLGPDFTASEDSVASTSGNNS